jgi:hypothetical protein
MLASQFAALEPPAADEGVIEIGIGRTPAEIVDAIIAAAGAAAAAGSEPFNASDGHPVIQGRSSHARSARDLPAASPVAALAHEKNQVATPNPTSSPRCPVAFAAGLQLFGLRRSRLTGDGRDPAAPRYTCRAASKMERRLINWAWRGIGRQGPSMSESRTKFG